MKNSIKYLLGLLLIPLFCLGVSFGAGFTDSSYLLEKITNGSLDSNNYSFKINDITTPFCLSFYNAVSSSSSNDSSFDIRACGVDQDNHEQCGIPYDNINLHFYVNTNSSIVCFDPNSWVFSMPWLTYTSIYVQGSFGNYSLTSVDYSVYSIGSYTPADCSSIQSQLNTCTSSLSTCNSDLSSCTNSCDTLVSQCQNDKATLQTSYSGCLESNASLNNYNSSLLDQLESCYLSGSTTTGDFTIFEYQLSRSDGLTDLYLPITNSIKLPYGYRGFLDNGVLAIKNLDSLDYAYNIDNSDFQENVVGSYSVVYLFLISSGLFLVFLYIVRRYFIGLKSIK